MKAVIMAGGKGSRFKPYTDLVPKPMIPVGRLEKPILEYIIAWLVRNGLKDFTFLVGHRWRQIFNYFGDGSRFGVKIEYSIDEPPYKGTGGAFLLASKRRMLSDNVLVWYGDILASVKIGNILSIHESRGADATLVVSERYQVPVGIATVRDGKVISMVEKPWLELNATIGVLTLNVESAIQVAQELGTNFDIMGDLIPEMIRRGYNVAAYLYSGPWYDVGSLERYQKLPEEELEEFLTTPWP